jgi:hypothetical protein
MRILLLMLMLTLILTLAGCSARDNSDGESSFDQLPLPPATDYLRETEFEGHD